MYRHGGMGAGGWILMTVGMVAFWTMVVLLVLALIRYLNRAPRPDGHSHGGWQTDGAKSVRPAQQILAERFARGEIDEDEYQQRSSTLREAED